MRTAFSTLALTASLVLGAAAFTGCETDQAGVKSSYRSQWTNIDATTDEATQAAEAALNELGLNDVESRSTKVDGQAMGKTADGTKVTVSVARVTEETSQISVNVGRTGDPQLGKQIIADITDRIAQQ